MSSFNFEFEKTVGDMCKFVPTWHLEYLTHICPKHEFIYIETPKVGCSLVKTVLQDVSDRRSRWYVNRARDIHDRAQSPLLSPSQVPNFRSLLNDSSVFKFCFVRNPYTRLLSAYLDKIRRGGEQKIWVLLQLGLNPTDYSAEISFESFVEAVIEQPFSYMDIHWRPQYYQVFYDTVSFDFIGRFERLREDFAFTVSNLKQPYPNLQSRLEHLTSHATGASGRLNEYYSETLREKVFRKYEIDFKAFGYTSELPQA